MKGKLGGLMQQAQKMQEQMQKQQEELVHKIIEGDMDPVVNALIAHNQAELLKGQDD